MRKKALDISPSRTHLEQRMRTKAETVGQFIRRIREEKNASMRQVSDAADISLGFLSDIERGYRAFSTETLAALARALKIAPADLQRRVDAQRVTELRDKIKKIEGRQ